MIFDLLASWALCARPSLKPAAQYAEQAIRKSEGWMWAEVESAALVNSTLELCSDPEGGSAREQ